MAVNYETAQNTNMLTEQISFEWSPLSVVAQDTIYEYFKQLQILKFT